ncbi:MAG: N-acetyltransferase [Gemmatimonadaceae bacterium]
MIEPLGIQHVKAVTGLHCQTLTGLLSQLGKPAVEAFYTGCLRSNRAVALVYLVDAKVRGFVLGSMRPDLLKRDVLRKNVVGTLSSIAIGVASRPSSLISLIESFRGNDEKAFDARTPELIYLATAPESRGAGVGNKLVKAFDERMRVAGAGVYELSVDEDNVTAITFYERLGFHFMGHYREFGIPHRRYRMVIH